MPYFTLLYFVVSYCSRYSKLRCDSKTLLIFGLLPPKPKKNLYRLHYIPLFLFPLQFSFFLVPQFDIVFPHNLCISKWVRTFIYILSILQFSHCLPIKHECVCMEACAASLTLAFTPPTIDLIVQKLREKKLSPTARSVCGLHFFSSFLFFSSLKFEYSNFQFRLLSFCCFSETK